MRYILRGSANLLMHHRRQMSVGQGGFHVGSLGPALSDVELPDKRGLAGFTRARRLYVYDCGSEPKRQVVREIEALKVVLPDKRIDLLVLSHFDRDHICGTPRLLHKRTGFAVGTVMLPYLTELEKIATLAKVAAKAEAEAADVSLDPFLVSLIEDPVAALSEFDPEMIILVRGDVGDAESPADSAPGDPPSDSRREEASSADGWAIRPSRPDRPMEVVSTPGRQTEVLTVKNASLVWRDPASSIAWKMHPYVQSPDAANLSTFQKEVEQLFGWPVGAFEVRAKASKVRREMVTTRRTGMARAYKAAFGDKNLTSLSLYSGPDAPGDVDALSLWPCHEANPLTKVGWLGTGDADLSNAVDIRAFEAAYRTDIDLVTTFVFPHHGSLENSDPGRLVSHADTWVAAADPLHDWKHPHWKLQAAVEGINATFRHVRRWPATAFSETFLLWRRP